MPLTKLPSHIALLDFLRSYKSIERELSRILRPDLTTNEERDGIFDFIVQNNSSEHYLHLEDSYDLLRDVYHKDFIHICNYLADKHYKLDQNHTIFVKKNYLESLKLVESSIDHFLIEGFFIYQSSLQYKASDRFRFLEKNVYDMKFVQHSIIEGLESLSDLHMHLGASMRIEYRLNSMLIAPSKIDESVIPKESAIELNDADVRIKDLVYSLSVLEQVLIQDCLSGNQGENDIQEILSLLEQKHFFLLRDKHDDFIQIRSDKYLHIGTTKNFLLYLAYRHFITDKIIYADRFLMLFFIELLYTSTNMYVKSAVKIYFMMRNILKVYLVQQHARTGFGYFSTYSRSTLRRAKVAHEKRDIIYSMFTLSQQLEKPLYLEARITPKSTPKALYEDLKGYVDAFKEFQEVDSVQCKLKFIYHFIKQRNDITKPRYEILKASLKKESLALVTFLSSRHYEDDLRPYIAGIDAASREYYTPPYVFAPIYRYFQTTQKLSSFYADYTLPYRQKRKEEHSPFREDREVEHYLHSVIQERYLNREIEMKDRSIKLKYTYHVGEDFRDILSGIRSIFEAVLFLNLREGDRVGHAIALGLDAEHFYARIGMVELSYEELFDNMVFVYYLLEIYASSEREIQRYKAYAKQTIFETGRYIYGDWEKTFDIDDFIDAWLLRRNCFTEYETMKRKFRITGRNLEEFEKYKACMILQDSDYTISALPDFFDAEIDEKDLYEKRYHTVRHNTNALQIYESYMGDYKGREGESIQSSYVINRGQERYKKRLLHCAKTVHFIQEIVRRDMILKRNIAIEVMPTSNLLISHMHTHAEHPMYQFKKVTKSDEDIRIYIASDNPMLQNTNIAKEYDYVYSYLKSEYGQKEAFRYLQDIAFDAQKEFLR